MSSQCIASTELNLNNSVGSIFMCCSESECRFSSADSLAPGGGSWSFLRLDSFMYRVFVTGEEVGDFTICAGIQTISATSLVLGGCTRFCCSSQRGCTSYRRTPEEPFFRYVYHGQLLLRVPCPVRPGSTAPLTEHDSFGMTISTHSRFSCLCR